MRLATRVLLRRDSILPVLLALEIVSCGSPRRGGSLDPEPSESATGAARAADAKPVCASVQACLRALGGNYDPARDAEVRVAVARCFGATAEQRWLARTCSPIAFEHDPRTGRVIEAYVECGEVCAPRSTRTGIRYVDVPYPECLCLGGSPLEFWGDGAYYGGCEPVTFSPAQARDFLIEDADDGDHAKYRVCFAGASRRDPRLRIPNEPVASVDGAPINDPKQLEDVVLRLPQDPPRVIQMAKTERDRLGREIHFIDGSTLGALVRSMEELQLPALPPPKHCAPKPAPVTVQIDGRSFSADFACHDEETRRFRELVRRLEEAARAIPPRPRTPPPACEAIGELPTQFVLRRDDHDVELRYVDWMRSSGARPDTYPRSCPGTLGRLSFGAVSVTGGRLEHAERTVRQMRSDMLLCYTNNLVASVRGEFPSLDLTIEVGASGESTAVTVAPRGPVNTSIVDCVKARARKARFARPSGGSSLVRTAITFQR
jgi:hypothetical protein